MPNIAPLLIAALVLAAIWGIYLFPSISGGRKEAPLNSTEDFDRWTHLMADVQRRAVSQTSMSSRDLARARRRRTLAVLGVIAVATLVAAYAFSSVAWLLGHLAVDAVIAWYIGMLLQLRQRQQMRSATRHEATRPHDADEPPVRIVAGQ